jgi:hypothetical protein
MTRPDEELSAGERRGYPDPDERDPEAPAEDAAEQSEAVRPVDERTEVRRDLEVAEWDAVEQSIMIDMGDDDYDR